jgi:hypothetical protein
MLLTNFEPRRREVSEVSSFRCQGKPASLRCENYKGSERYYFIVDGEEIEDKALIGDRGGSYSISEDRRHYLQMRARIIVDSPNDIILLPRVEQ